MMNGSESNGSKISLGGDNGLWNRLKKMGCDTSGNRNRSQFNPDLSQLNQTLTPLVIWKEICLLVVKSLVCVNSQMSFQPCCFEVFGYDVLIDRDMRPWLLEVNFARLDPKYTPSLTRLYPNFINLNLNLNPNLNPNLR
jgi:Tubulin-tyrosine ligase family